MSMIRHRRGGAAASPGESDATTDSRPGSRGSWLLLLAVAAAILLATCLFLIRRADGDRIAPSLPIARPTVEAAAPHPTDLHASLNAFEAALDAYSLAYAHAIPEDRTIFRTELPKIRTALTQLSALVDEATTTSNQDASLSTWRFPLEIRFRVAAIPLRLLATHVQHRSGLIKTLLQHELHGAVDLTRRQLDAYDEKTNEGALLAPTRAFLDHFGATRWQRVVASTDADSSKNASFELHRVLLEYAVKRDLVEMTRLLLPLLASVCSADVNLGDASSRRRRSMLEIARNNGGGQMAALLRQYGGACTAPSGAPPPPQAFDSEADDVESHRQAARGGWRASASNDTSKFFASQQSRGCPFTRVPLSSLTREALQAHYENKQPLIVTDVLDAQRWSIVERLTRESILRDWRDFNITAGSIPYGEHFGVRGGLVTFEEFLQYMDTVYVEQQHDPNIVSRGEITPYYIFDSSLLNELGWFNQNSATDSSSRSSRVDRDFYELPPVLAEVLRDSTPNIAPLVGASPTLMHPREVGFASQLYLGPEGSGAPFHFHCPAVNLLVYGKKHWWFHQPRVGFYSKQSVVPSLLMSRPYPSQLADPYACVQHPGELFFVPAQWSHATLNAAESIGIAVEFDVGGC